MANYLTNSDYQFVVDRVPITCVDVIPVQQNNGNHQIGVITRSTGSQQGKLALIGGRIYKDELIDQAIQRHLHTDLALSSFTYYSGRGSWYPFFVQQYVHGSEAPVGLSFDPTKHSIALTYLITITEEPQPRAEASAFHWLTEDQIDNRFGFRHDIVAKAAFREFAKYHK